MSYETRQRRAAAQSKPEAPLWAHILAVLLFGAILGSVLFLVGCGEREGRPTPIRCDFADADMGDC